MADPRTRRRQLQIVAESTFSADPSSGYVPVEGVVELGDITDGLTVIETNRFTGRDGMTPSIAGPDGGSFSATVEAIGFDSQVGDGSSPPTDDWMDILLEHVLGDVVERDGITVSSHSGTALDLGASGDLYDLEDGIIPLVTSGGVSRWARIAADAGDGSYTLGADPGITATLVPGTRMFRWDGSTDLTSTLTAVYDQDDQQYTMTGVRAGSLSVSIQPDQQARLAYEFQVDDITASSKSLTANDGKPGSTPLRTACVYVNDVEVDVASIEIDFGLTAQARVSTCQDTGRSEMLLVGLSPTITINPIFTNTLLELKRNQTERNIIVQLGTGTRSIAFYAPVAQVTEATREDANGLQRLGLTYSVRDSGSSNPRFIVARI